MGDDADLVDELLLRMADDPAKWKQQQDFVRGLEMPIVRTLGKALGFDTDEVFGSVTDLRESVGTLLVAAAEFGRFGWTVTPRVLRDTDYVEAVRLWQETHDEATIDKHLTRAWASGTWFRSAYGPLTTLAGRHEATLDLLLERNRLMDKALAHHEAKEYEASTMLVLSQVDGLTFDFTENAFGFFLRAEDEDFEDDETVMGMPQFLRIVRHAVSEREWASSVSEGFRRHPIMHGRYLRFGTETNSTKAFALMAGVLDWLRPKAKVLTERWQTEYEQRWAGSLERDADGKRMDRRGFIETRDGLRWLAIRETSEHRKNGRYNGDLHAMFPAEGIGRMQRRDRTTLTVTPDGQMWWAWCQSDTPLVFGIGGRDGEVASYYYADDEPPGALGEDDRWVHEFDDRPPDWAGE